MDEPKFKLGDKVTSWTRINDAMVGKTGPLLEEIRGVSIYGTSFQYKVNKIGNINEENLFTLKEAKEAVMKKQLERIQNIAQWPVEEPINV